MERRYRECDNQSQITLECNTAFQPIKTQESGHVIKVYWHWSILCILTYFCTRIFFITNIRPTSKRALCRVSTFGRPHGPCHQADTQPDTLVDTRPHTPFEVGFIYFPRMFLWMFPCSLGCSFCSHLYCNTMQYLTCEGFLCTDMTQEVGVDVHHTAEHSPKEGYPRTRRLLYLQALLHPRHGGAGGKVQIWDNFKLSKGWVTNNGGWGGGGTKRVGGHVKFYP